VGMSVELLRESACCYCRRLSGSMQAVDAEAIQAVTAAAAEVRWHKSSDTAAVGRSENARQLCSICRLYLHLVQVAYRLYSSSETA